MTDVSSTVLPLSANEFAPAAAHLPTALTGYFIENEDREKPASALTLTIKGNNGHVCSEPQIIHGMSPCGNCLKERAKKR